MMSVPNQPPLKLKSEMYCHIGLACPQIGVLVIFKFGVEQQQHTNAYWWWSVWFRIRRLGGRYRNSLLEFWHSRTTCLLNLPYLLMSFSISLHVIYRTCLRQLASCSVRLCWSSALHMWDRLGWSGLGVIDKCRLQLKGLVFLAFFSFSFQIKST